MTAAVAGGGSDGGVLARLGPMVAFLSSGWADATATPPQLSSWESPCCQEWSLARLPCRPACGSLGLAAGEGQCSMVPGPALSMALCQCQPWAPPDATRFRMTVPSHMALDDSPGVNPQTLENSHANGILDLYLK